MKMFPPFLIIENSFQIRGEEQDANTINFMSEGPHYSVQRNGPYGSLAFRARQAGIVWFEREVSRWWAGKD